MLAALIICHLCGDFLLQNHWMQRKAQSSFVCWVHIWVYMLPFAAVAGPLELPNWFLLAISAEHFLQDRFALHLKWMRFYQHTTPDKWPVGPLCVDQAMHLTFILILTLFLPSTL
jgi:hypothetical protein